NTLRSTHSTYPSVHAVGLAEPCAKTNRRRPPQPALCPKAPAALKPAAKIAKTHPPQTQICHGISAREKCRLIRPEIDKAREKQRCHQVKQPVPPPCFAGKQVQDRPRDDAEAQPIRNRVGKRNEYQGEKCRDRDERF